MVAVRRTGSCCAAFAFEDELRAGAREAVDALKAAGIAVEIVSGDHEGPVRALASALGVPCLAGGRAGGKVARIAALAAAGRKVLMVGDGLNDAPALAAAHVSMAPASAADIGRNAADIVFLREDLEAVPQAIAIAACGAGLVRQNLLLAVAYNVLAVPSPSLGLVTPLVAAIAMSASSILVVANALRLGWRPGAASGRSLQVAQTSACAGRRGRRMSDFFFLIPVALVLGAAGWLAFLWSLRSGQYEDLDGAAERILFDDDVPLKEPSKPKD